MEGRIHVYTGNGKGKTTAALGLALRAVGAGKKVFIAQFVKGMHYSEIAAIKRLSPDLSLKQYGRKNFIQGKPEPEDVSAAKTGLEEIRQLFRKGLYDIIILDEINIATHMQLIPVEDLLSLIEMKPPGLELVLTGRNADPRIIDRADLVTEMREVKHYYQKGVKARTGIEK